MRILVVDDVEDARIYLDAILSASGYETELAEDGEAALERIRAQAPDLVITDLLMPRLDGFDLCRRIKSDPETRDIPVIVYTATYTEDADRDLAHAAGAARFVIKPAEPDVLLAEVEELLQGDAAAPAPEADAARLEQMHAAALERKLQKRIRQLESERLARETQSRRFADFAEVSSDWFWETDADLRLTEFTSRMAEVTGLSREALLSRRLSDLVAGGDTRHSNGPLAGVLAARAPFRDHAFEFAGPKGDRLILSLSGKPVLDAAGGFTGYRGTGSDITERVAQEDQMAQLHKHVALGQMTGGIAHDFNNILSVIQGNLEFLSDRPEDEALVRTYISEAMDATQRGADLARRLMLFGGRQPLKARRIDMGATLEELHPILQRAVGGPVRIAMTCAPEIWPVQVDPGQLEQAILNLAINARDAMPEGGTMAIAARNLALDAPMEDAASTLAAGDYVELSVSDSGTGISGDDLDRIFEPYFTTKPPGRGNGLGLSTVLGFMKQSGGTVRVETGAGTGTTIRLYFPRLIELA